MAYFFTDRFTGIDREKLQKKVGKRKLVFMKQIHSDIVETVNKNTSIKECDAMITSDKSVALCVVVADCIPAILIDEIKGVVGVAHAGREGSYKNIVKKTVMKMEKEFTCKDIKIIFGPSIKKCCYEVGEEVIKGFKEFTCKENGKTYLDLIALNTKKLKNVTVDSTCTCCDENYFSYRRDNTKKRFCGVVYLP